MRNRIMLTIIMIVSFSLPVYAQQENRVWLPIIGTGADVVSSSDVPKDFILQGYSPEDDPMWGPPLNTHIAPARLEELKSQEGELIYMDGPETLGQVIDLTDGRKLTLPPDVYVEAYVISAMCPAGIPCPEAPYRVLGKKGTTDQVTLLRDGTLRVLTESPLVLARVAVEFTGVVVQLDSPILDPALPQLKLIGGGQNEIK